MAAAVFVAAAVLVAVAVVVAVSAAAVAVVGFVCELVEWLKLKCKHQTPLSLLRPVYRK